MHNLADSIYLWFCKKTKGSVSGKVRSQGIIGKLCEDILNDPVAVRKALMALRADGRLRYSAGQHGEPISGYITVIKAEEETPVYARLWKEVVTSSSLLEQEQRALEPVGHNLDGFSKGDMSILLNRLIKLREDQFRLQGQLSFNVSASYLMGSSKLLSTLDTKALKTFGIMTDRFTPRAPYIVVGGNTQSPLSVILIENPIPFETAVASNAAAHCLFICTFGFGLSAATNDYGNQLAGVVENGNACILNRSNGTLPVFEQLLEHPCIQFWGDLDIAGMQIFERIAAIIPHVQLSALYGPMLEAIRDVERRHPYVIATGKQGQKQYQSNRHGVQQILPPCERYAVDQEIVLPVEIESLAGRVLDISPLGKIPPPS